MTVSTKVPKLFQPLKVGRMDLQHRVVLAPLTRVRNHANHVPGPELTTYYAQRGSTPGTLLVSEATYVAPQAKGTPFAPGIWNEEQKEGWKHITDAVHAKGSFIYLQLWAQGRTAHPQDLASTGHDLVAPSAIPCVDMTGQLSAVPRALTIPEIKEYIRLYGIAAQNAIEAGFDGVEIHGANGYLPDQFLQDVSNTRTDEYGGSIENRAKFVLEVVDSITEKVGADRTAIRLSPWGRFQSMGMEDPVPTFSYLASQLAARELSYLHVIEPRADESTQVSGTNDFVRKIWGDRPYIAAGGNTRDIALQEAEEKGGMFAFGRHYISNPDLPRRLKENIPLTPYDRSKFYMMGSHTPEGYTDYPFTQ
ncbi:FMN-linked oxidoreductase [Coniophora puteana RWD-64-598 SS2]|uniref:FMN-linked oxidoreductase n=1 Tax=Coniophora puteana (strain RWD-64-598) TaxID=741705 RepID=A0A5M3M876_CONPW|nr:FMN-linked oxidoreductase [Coniophora puteana RWD-64-598 SS2]EIW75438.1 FMN-linked oxidoreductase [Coniophora puteana RWD-64-598 SS2]